MSTKNQPQRRSLQSRIDTAIANEENTQIAGLDIEPQQVQHPQTVIQSVQNKQGGVVMPFPTKKATTIMPKEVFNALQHYCTDSDTPKHRAIYMFIIDGLRSSGTISDEDYKRFREMASQLTTTYTK